MIHSDNMNPDRHLEDMARLAHNAQETAHSAHVAHEAAVAHANHRLHERTVQARVKTVNGSASDYPMGPIGRGRGDYQGSDLAPGTYSQKTSKQKGQNLGNAHTLPHLAGGGYV